MNGFLFHLRRKNDEEGFILPVTLMITFLMFAFVLHEMKMYEAEKQFIKAREEMMILEGLMRKAVYDVEKGVPEYDHGTLVYADGKVKYNVDFRMGNVLVLTLVAVSHDGGKHVSHAFYDKIKQKIVRWEENE
ncbi:MAG TPA: competence type IV pilus minor pilin ComGG [Bacillales bacterium]|nr:competence type IV pilus minor pilin ComGG [Bacillales bacterium]